jgi:hypothetical protein
MQLLSGVVLLAGGILALLMARPKHGQPRFFVGTSFESAVAIALVMALGIGVVLTIRGTAEALS